MRRRELLDADWQRLCTFSGNPTRLRRWYDLLAPRFATIVLFRTAHDLHSRGYTRLARVFSLANYFLFGIEVPARLAIGPGLVIPHSQGTVIGASSIGQNVTIYQQVTLGAKFADFEYDLEKRPVVEDDVVITAGAKVLGPVRLAKGCIIGANAVVITDIPAGVTAVGVPARVLHEKDKYDQV